MVHKFLYWMEGVGFFKSLMHDFKMELQENKKGPILGKSHLLIHPSVNLLKSKFCFKDSF